MKGKLFALFFFAGLAANAQAYFQQHIATKIEVRLDDEKHYLHGFEEFIYTNNSPDTLHYIYLHLWPNAYLNDHTPFVQQQVTVAHTSAFYFSKPINRGFIDSLDISVNGKKTAFVSTDASPDIARIDLPEALLPGAKCTVSTPFRVKIPKVYSRMGHTKQAYYISQWFPKPAVYDLKGWHPMPYLDQGEFYSEIGSYEVSITLPKNYVVMGTGNITDAAENGWLDSLSNAPLPPFPRKANGSKHWIDSINRFPNSSIQTKTIHFQEDNVHDFAFFADKRYIVRKDTFSLANGHAVTAYAAFLPASKTTWIKATDYIRETVQRLSTEVGPYPYKTVKAVQGDMHAGGGMEYPTVTIIDGTISTASGLRTVVVHEVGHNWFQGILATNERDNPWMDEGINTFYEQKISRQLGRVDTSRNKGGNITLSGEDLIYFQGVAGGTDQSFCLPATAYSIYNYGADVYYKTAYHIEWLEGYMGKDAFRAAMQDYFTNWKHRHPSPEDFKACMQRHTDKPLNWFFRDALQNDRRIDFALKSVRNKGDHSEAILVNKSPFAAPVRLDAYRDGKIIDSTWTAPFEGRTNISLPDNNADTWRIGAESPDARLTNNHYSKAGLFHGRGLQPSFGFGLNRTERTHIYLLPALGYNAYDGFMAGVLIHNLSIPEKKFRFAIAPVYGFRAKEFSGTGTAGYFMHPESNLFQELAAGVEGKTFNYTQTDHNTPTKLYARYLKVAPYLMATFKNQNATSPVTDRLLLKGYFIRENYFDFLLDTQDSLYKPSSASQEKKYGLLRYTHQNDRLFNPFSYNAEAQLGADFAKISIEGKLRIDYNTKSKSLYVRVFAGKFISINNQAFGTDRYLLNTTFNGANDYLYDDTYLGRSERDGLGYHQVSMREGGFKIPTDFYSTPLGRSDDWLASLNLKTDLPLGKLPLRLFLDVATFANAASLNPSGDKILYEGGLELHLLRDVILVNVPLVYSKDYGDYLKSIYPTKRFGHTISFTLQLQNINWLNTVSSGLKFLTGG